MNIVARSKGRSAEPWSALGWTLVSALAYAAAFPPLGWWPLGWIALVPLFLAMRTVSPARAALLGGVWGVVMAYGVGDWMPRAVHRYFGQPPPLGALVFLGCAVVTASVQYGAFGWLHHRLERHGPWVRAWLLAAGWIAAELARVKPVTGNPWALLGYGQTHVAPLVQIADLGGVYAVGLAPILVNAALACAWASWRQGVPAPRALAPSGPVALMVAAILAYGVAHLGAPERTEQAADVSVLAVQGDLDLGTQWDPRFYGQNLATYASLTAGALARHPSSLVVWPENALTFFVEQEMAYRGYLGELLHRFGAQLLTGGPREVLDDAGIATYRNGAFVLDDDGMVVAAYEKQQLVPLAEYFPWPELDFLQRRFGRVREFSTGSAQAPLPTVAGPAGVMICNEAMFGENAIERVRAGARWLAVLTNDGWVGEPLYAAIAFEMTRLRAVEVRRWMVRSSTSGPSAIIDPLGRLTRQLGLDTQGTIAASITPRDGLTPYARIGDAFAWGCALVALIAACVPARGDDRAPTSRGA